MVVEWQLTVSSWMRSLGGSFSTIVPATGESSEKLEVTVLSAVEARAKRARRSASRTSADRLATMR